jgi:hypothetical protein
VSRRTLRAIGLLLLVLASIEVASRVAVAILDWGKPDVFYVARPVSRDAYAHYLAARDPLLGWPRPARLVPPEYDAAGSRVVPAYSDPCTSARLRQTGCTHEPTALPSKR